MNGLLRQLRFRSFSKWQWIEIHRCRMLNVDRNIASFYCDAMPIYFIPFFLLDGIACFLSTSLPDLVSAGKWTSGLLMSANPRILAANDENDARVARKKRPPRVCAILLYILLLNRRKLCETITREADRRKRSRVRRPISRKQPARIRNITHSNSGNIATDEKPLRSHFVCFDYSLCINWLNTYISHLTNEPLFNY